MCTEKSLVETSVIVAGDAKDDREQDSTHNAIPESKAASAILASSRPSNDLERNGLSTPENAHASSEEVPSMTFPSKNKWRMVAACMLAFSQAMGDAAAGALIPYLQSYYHINYIIVSLIFITMTAGFLSTVLFVEALRARVGRAKTLLFCQVLVTAGYIPIVCTAPYPVVVICFYFVGVGVSSNLALSNVFVANLKNGTNWLGILHGSYGIGGTIAPMIATAMVTRGHLVWSRFYLTTLALYVFNLVFATWAFAGFESEMPSFWTSDNATLKTSEHIQRMFTAAKQKPVLLGAFFILTYQGAEVSISGWVISFLIESRNGDPSSVGYVTAGFWAGITLGRFLVTPLAQRTGEWRFVVGLTIGAAVFQGLVWGVPNVIGDAVAVSVVGLLLGPVYPCATTVFVRLVPKHDQVNGLSFISASGSVGGAIAPFTTGLLAQAAGTWVLHPIAIGCFGIMLICWFWLPRRSGEEAAMDHQSQDHARDREHDHDH